MKPMTKQLLLAVSALFFTAQVSASSWPDSTVTIVAPYDAGSTPDFVARTVGERLTEKLGQPFIVENKSGAAGNIGTQAVARAKPNGLTFGVSIAGALGVNALLGRDIPYDVDEDLDLLTIGVSQPSVLVTGDRLQAQDAQELIERLKAGEEVSFASIGAGSISHLAMAALMSEAKANAVHVPYRGSAAAAMALLSGDVDMGLLPAAAVMPHVNDGKLTALAVAVPERSPSLPEIPTLAEIGLPDITGDAWIGFIAPAGLDKELRDTLQAELVAVLAEEEVQERFRKQYMDAIGNSSEAFKDILQADMQRWQTVIEQTDMDLD